MTLRASKTPRWFGREHTGHGPVNHVAAHRVLRHNPIDAHRMPVHELAIVELGSLGLRLDGEAVTVPAGHLLVIPPRVLIEGAGRQAMNAGLFYWLGISVPKVREQALPPWAGHVEAMIAQLEAASLRPIPISAALIEQVGAYFEQVRDESATAAERFGASWQVVGRLCRELAGDKHAGTAVPSQVAPALRLIDESLTDPPTIDALAARCGLHRGKFTRLFREATGLTPRDYINRRRVEHARQLLCEPDATITGVALRLGFSSSQYFASVFRKFTGQTPTAFRRARDG